MYSLTTQTPESHRTESFQGSFFHHLKTPTYQGSPTPCTWWPSCRSIGVWSNWMESVKDLKESADKKNLPWHPAMTNHDLRIFQVALWLDYRIPHLWYRQFSLHVSGPSWWIAAFSWSEIGMSTMTSKQLQSFQAAMSAMWTCGIPTVLFEESQAEYDPRAPVRLRESAEFAAFCTRKPWNSAPCSQKCGIKHRVSTDQSKSWPNR